MIVFIVFVSSWRATSVDLVSKMMFRVIKRLNASARLSKRLGLLRVSGHVRAKRHDSRRELALL